MTTPWTARPQIILPNPEQQPNSELRPNPEQQPNSELHPNPDQQPTPDKSGQDHVAIKQDGMDMVRLF